MLRITLPQSIQRGDVPMLPMIDDIENGDHKTFELSVDVYLKDVCPYQNTYFSRYLEWQGMCRERFLAEKILAGVDFKGIFLTKCCHQEYVDETFAFQRIRVLLNTFQLKMASSFLLFRFIVGDQTVSAGYQQIVCAGHDRQIQRFPDEIYERAHEYEIMPNSIVPASVIGRQPRLAAA
jgi:acyl-CoA thioesterase FadM